MVSFKEQFIPDKSPIKCCPFWSMETVQFLGWESTTKWFKWKLILSTASMELFMSFLITKLVLLRMSPKDDQSCTALKQPTLTTTLSSMSMQSIQNLCLKPFCWLMSTDRSLNVMSFQTQLVIEDSGITSKTCQILLSLKCIEKSSKFQAFMKLTQNPQQPKES